MKILVLDWNSYAHEYILEEFRNADCLVNVFPWPFGSESMRENQELCASLETELRENEYNFVFSFNFFPVAAKACNECGIKYVSWIYDTPYLLLYSKYTKLETNYIYFFDKTIYKEFQKYGVKNVFYLPLAAPISYYDSLKTVNDEKYIGDISFVGSTYQEDRQDFFKHLKKVNAYTKGYLRSIMSVQKELYGDFILEKLLNDSIIGELKRVCPIQKEEDEWESDAWIYANYFLARKMTGEQRVEILKMLSEHFNIKLYSKEYIQELDKVEQCGEVDYVEQMPYVFKNTKINLNMTLRSICSGIPLRAMDIMGCGGFLLTNYQEDFLEYFEPDVDYVFYSDNHDLQNKVEYYLAHEEERQEIAHNGYKKVAAGHTYAERVKKILLHMKEQ